jgi:uncharacterized membrane protein
MILLIVSLIGLVVCITANGLATYSTYKDRSIPGYKYMVGVFVTHFLYYSVIALLIVYRMLSAIPYDITTPRIISAVVVLIPAFALARLALFLTGRLNG